MERIENNGNDDEGVATAAAAAAGTADVDDDDDDDDDHHHHHHNDDDDGKSVTFVCAQTGIQNSRTKQLMMQGLIVLLAAALVCFASCSGQSCDPGADRICPAIHAPVCATFKKTFANECDMESQLCRLAQDGFVFTEESRSGDCCSPMCTFEYSPLCTSGGRTYPNLCTLLYARCSARDYIKVVHPGQC
ncbi:hypothetical protein PoB_000889000 [Plakobranchus ocellatus]|uniref:Kazal-like domain-containing protein n=1 Tax=Plakobranchus ocellatus TaxID=259542 RepID=A0AAV3YH28_9GAST|nr:hypothetical protein PoB_000889000 [Plakobranchus ocellatus]